MVFWSLEFALRVVLGEIHALDAVPRRVDPCAGEGGEAYDRCAVAELCTAAYTIRSEEGSVALPKRNSVHCTTIEIVNCKMSTRLFERRSLQSAKQCACKITRLSLFRALRKPTPRL